MKYEYEAVIIGGGPAGSTAAANLAGAGIETALFERSEFPRETLCGEFLSKEVLNFISSENILNEFKCLKPNQLNSFRYIDERGNETSSELGFRAFALRRSVLDSFLLHNAAEKGARVCRSAEVKNIEKADKGFILTVSSKDEIYDVKTRFLISAHGKRSGIDTLLKRNFINYKSKQSGIKFHLNKINFSCLNLSEIRIYSAKRIYCGINAVDNDLVTVCFLHNGKDPSGTPVDHLLNFSLVCESFGKLFKSDLKDLIGKSKIFGAGNIYFGKKSPAENGIFMIGDAAGVIAPLAGDGIGMAVQSSNLAAGIIGEIKNGRYSEEKGCEIYTNEWNNLFRKRLLAAGAVQKILFNNTARNASALVLKMFPGILPHIIKLTRHDAA